MDVEKRREEIAKGEMTGRVSKRATRTKGKTKRIERRERKREMELYRASGRRKGWSGLRTKRGQEMCLLAMGIRKGCSGQNGSTERYQRVRPKGKSIVADGLIDRE